MQDHEWFIRDQNNKDKDSGSQARVSADHAPTTWADLKALGVDPENDPFWPEKYSQVVVKDMQGMDLDKALIKEARRQNVSFAQVWK